MSRYRGNPHRRRGFLGEAVHMGRKMLYSADHFFRAAGPTMKQIAMVAAPAISAMGPTGKIVGSGIAAIGSAADGYSQLRGQLGD